MMCKPISPNSLLSAMLTIVPPPACKRREMKSLFPTQRVEIAVRFAPSGWQGLAKGEGSPDNKQDSVRSRPEDREVLAVDNHNTSETEVYCCSEKDGGDRNANEVPNGHF